MRGSCAAKETISLPQRRQMLEVLVKLTSPRAFWLVRVHLQVDERVVLLDEFAAIGPAFLICVSLARR